MKKLIALLMFCCFAVFGCACFGKENTSNGGSGAGSSSYKPPVVETLKLEDERRCENCDLKLWADYSSTASYYITPTGFEMDKLANKNYKMRITVSYSVYYEKDYDVWWDIGYAGAPEYDVYIVNSDLMGVEDKNLTTKTSSMTRSIVYQDWVTNIRNTRLTLTFNTNNVQNIVHIRNIKVTYKCYK